MRHLILNKVVTLKKFFLIIDFSILSAQGLTETVLEIVCVVLLPGGSIVKSTRIFKICQVIFPFKMMDLKCRTKIYADLKQWLIYAIFSNTTFYIFL